MTVTEIDNGKTFNLSVGQSVIASLPDIHKTATAASTNPNVIKQTAGPTSDGPTMKASFGAVKAGTARLKLSFKDCTDAIGVACFVEVSVNAIQLPDPKVQFSDVNSGRTATVQVGDKVLLTLVALDERQVLGSGPAEKYWHLQVEPPGVMEWSLPPTIFPHKMLRGVLKAISPGQATLSGVAPTCDPTDKACVHQVVFHITVVQ